MHTQTEHTNILPTPFTWAHIPGGTVTLTHSGGYITVPLRVEVAAFAIARYPITHGQFAIFVDSPDGYQDHRWWDFSTAAQMWRLENDMPVDVAYGDDTHPRVHLTWYEAVAFCRWLGNKTGTQIGLPTEAEWQLAAQGDDERPYPWGHEWDPDRCTHNLAHDQIGPTGVTTYEGRGESQHGVVDMLGNVWEWCATNWHTGSADTSGDSARVLRGGSWFDDVLGVFRTTHRSSWMPDLTSDLRGFRIVLRE